MLDAAYSRQKLHVDHAAVRARRQLIIPLVAAFVLVGGGSMAVWSFSASKAVAPRASDELLETTKGLEVTQQQAVDQLQIVQDQLVAQQTETKKLSEQIATLTEKLDALQQWLPISRRRPLQRRLHNRKPRLRRNSACAIDTASPLIKPQRRAAKATKQGSAG